MSGGRGKVLISGASIAGPTLAYWLDRYGFEVTLVERAPAVRSGGYAIDIRATALDVVRRMGILPELQAAQLHMRRITFVNERGKVVGGLSPQVLMGSEHDDIELPRGALTDVLYALTKDRIQYRFNDSIASLADDGRGVDVTFKSGVSERYDLVCAADGIHSSTRRMVFGEESQFSRYLGYCFGLCELPNPYGYAFEAVSYNTPGKLALIYATDDSSIANALLVLKRPEPSRAELADARGQGQYLIDGFADDGWIVPDIRRAMAADEELYADAMMQIFMPSWSKGRVALVGDSAHAPSFFSGQGVSLALVTGYVLAGELATHGIGPEAFAAYERTARKFVEANQATAKDGCDTMAPDSSAKLWLRNRMVSMAPVLSRLGLISRNSRKIHSSLKLPTY